ncbi:MAG TPA: choice-of-anchor L domain-containing protein [Flavobacterium sp.]|jgi:gliding motility-associated-like protein
MNILKNTILYLVVLVSTAGFSQYIQVDDTYSAQQLVEDVLIQNSPCAEVSNFVVGGDPFSNGEQSYGYFSEPTGAFPFSEGIVLSTSRASRTQGPNNNLIDEGSTDWVGDQDLQQALNLGQTYNATFLEFDFTPLTSNISFDYIFSSEEYQGTAPCRYSDGFAFLLKVANSTDPYQNLAIVPNTTTPVAVTTVHPQIGGSNGCDAINEAYFGGFNGNNHPTNFNGQTVVMTAQATVTPGVTYHIKLVIADEENIRYDSAIFLGGGSFNVGTSIGPDRLVATNTAICEGEEVTLDATEAGDNTYQWFKNGTSILGADDPQYSVDSPGTYTVEVNLGSNGCVAIGEAIIEYTPLPVLNNPTSLIQCDEDNDGVTIFNLTNIDDIVRLNNNDLGDVTYFTSLSDAENDVNNIENPQAYQSGDAVVIARVFNDFGCAGYATVNLLTVNNPIPVPAPFEICDTTGSQDGIGVFNLNEQVTPAITPNLPPGIIVQYYASEVDALTQSDPVDEGFSNTIPYQQTIFIRLSNGPDCYGILPLTLVINTFIPENFENEMSFICNDEPAVLNVEAGFQTYTWSTGAVNVHSVSVSDPGSYSVTVTNADGCSATKNFLVSPSEAASNINVNVQDFQENGNTVTIEYTGLGNYVFSIDGVNYQQSPVFENVAPGEYTAFVDDVNGCGNSAPFGFYVLDYPRFFTPNGDGFNDIWTITNINTQPDSVINIFDRYGKLLYSFYGNGIGWNGIYNGAPLPSTDYWFTLHLSGGRTIKSHFTLKR